jgi:hypothetical protein
MFKKRDGLVSFLTCRPTFHKILEKFTGLEWAGHIAGMAANKQVCKSKCRVSFGDPRLDGKIILKWILGKKFKDRYAIHNFVDEVN